LHFFVICELNNEPRKSTQKYLRNQDETQGLSVNAFFSLVNTSVVRQLDSVVPNSVTHRIMWPVHTI